VAVTSENSKDLIRIICSRCDPGIRGQESRVESQDSGVSCRVGPCPTLIKTKERRERWIEIIRQGYEESVKR